MNHPHPNAEKPAYQRDPRDQAGIIPDEVNARDNYSLHMVFKTSYGFPAAAKNTPDQLEQVQQSVQAIEETGVELRGFYDVGGFKSDADLMIWVLADSAEKCQAAYRAFLRSPVGQDMEPVWSAMSRHLPAEFNTQHLPACFGGVVARPYLAVYPFIRSWDWYYLPATRRSAILKEHGMNGRDYLDVQVSTLAAFGLGDFEWTVSLEADSLDRIMGVLRQQRDAEARLFVRRDTPFYTGVRMSLAEWIKGQRTFASDCCCEA